MTVFVGDGGDCLVSWRGVSLFAVGIAVFAGDELGCLVSRCGVAGVEHAITMLSKIIKIVVNNNVFNMPSSLILIFAQEIKHKLLCLPTQKQSYIPH